MKSPNPSNSIPNKDHEKSNPLAKSKSQWSTEVNISSQSYQADSALEQSVKKYGSNWKAIAKEISQKGFGCKTCKQCRERWLHYLDPNIVKGKFTEEEQKVIFEGQKEFGCKWVKIAERVPGKSDNAIKNFFYATVRKEIRRLQKDLKAFHNYKRIRISQTTYLNLVKKLQISVAHMILKPSQEIGELLRLMNKRKKKDSNIEEEKNSIPSAFQKTSKPENNPKKAVRLPPKLLLPCEDIPPTSRISSSPVPIQRISNPTLPSLPTPLLQQVPPSLSPYLPPYPVPQMMGYVTQILPPYPAVYGVFNYAPFVHSNSIGNIANSSGYIQWENNGRMQNYTWNVFDPNNSSVNQRSSGEERRKEQHSLPQ